MTTRQFKTVLDYLETANPDLYDVIGNLSFQYLFNVKGRKGVTFLMPATDKVNELVDLSTRDDSESADRVLGVLQAHIIYDTFKTPIEFLQREAVNAHGRALDVDKSKSSKAEIRLLSGGAFSPDTGFVDGSKAGTQVVYSFRGELMDAKSGVEPKSAPADDTPGRKKSAKVPPAPAPPKLMVDSIRFRIGIETANSHSYHILNGDDAADDYMMSVLSVVQFMDTRDELTRICLFGKVLPMISGVWMADFYLIFEPHTTQTDDKYLIPEATLTEWYEWKRRAKIDPVKVLAVIDGLLDRPSAFENAAIYRDRVSLLESLDDHIRRRIKCDSLPQDKLVAECIARYSAVAKSNTIGQTSGVYPTPLAEIYAADPCRKLLEDEFRHYVYLTNQRLMMTPDDQLSTEMRELDEKIADYLVNLTRGKFIDSKDRLRLLSPSIAAVHRSDSRRQFICEMINSTHFMFIPLSKRDLDPQRFPHDISMKRPRRDRIEYWSIAHAVADDLSRRYQSAVPTRKSGIKSLSKLVATPADDMDDDTRKQLEGILGSMKARKSGVVAAPKPPAPPAPEPQPEADGNSSDDGWGGRKSESAPSKSQKKESSTTKESSVVNPTTTPKASSAKQQTEAKPKQRSKN